MRDFLKKREKYIKYKKGNRVYTIHGGDENRKSNLNPYTNPTFDASPRPGDARLVIILIFPPQKLKHQIISSLGLSLSIPFW